MSKTKSIAVFTAATVAFGGAVWGGGKYFHKPAKPKAAPVVASVPAPKPKTCHIAGDGIAVGVAEFLKKCSVDAKADAKSGQIIGMVANADTLIVSVGTLNPGDKSLAKDVEAIRARATGKVVFVLPNPMKAKGLVAKVATDHHDETVEFKAGIKAPPKGEAYLALAKEVAKLIAE